MLEVGECLLKVEAYQFSDYCWTRGNPYWTWNPISFPIIAGYGNILAEHETLSVFLLMLDVEKSLLNVEAYQFPDYWLTGGNLFWTWKPISFPHYCWTWENTYWTWNPISFPINAGRGKILTERGTLSVFLLLLDKGKSLLNMEPYQFSDYCWTRGNLQWTRKIVIQLNVEIYQWSESY